MSRDIPTFRSSGQFQIAGRGLVYVIILDEDCDDPAWLLHREVRIDGKAVICRGIERSVKYIGQPGKVGEDNGVVVSDLLPDTDVAALLAKARCPYWADGQHCFAPDPPGYWPGETERPSPWEGRTKHCACGAEVKAR